MTDRGSHQDGYDLNFKSILNKDDVFYFCDEDLVRKDIYITLSNCENLSELCTKLLLEFEKYTATTMISKKAQYYDLLSILSDKANGIRWDVLYEEKALPALSFLKKNTPLSLFTEVKLARDVQRKRGAYSIVKNQKIGYQHIMYTTNPGGCSDSSNSAASSDSGSFSAISLESSVSSHTQIGSLGQPPTKKPKTCQSAGDFTLGKHRSNSSFNNKLRCFVEILILVPNASHCQNLADHMGIIFFDNFWQQEKNVGQCVNNDNAKLYNRAHTDVIKLMMEGYSSICITSKQEAWLTVTSRVKAIICTHTQWKFELKGFEDSADYIVCVEDEFLAYVEAVGQIVNESMLCNILIETKYQVNDKEFTPVHLPITFLIPFYIVKYFTQSYFTVHDKCSNIKPVDVFQPQNVPALLSPNAPKEIQCQACGNVTQCQTCKNTQS